MKQRVIQSAFIATKHTLKRDETTPFLQAALMMMPTNLKLALSISPFKTILEPFDGYPYIMSSCFTPSQSSLSEKENNSLLEILDSKMMILTMMGNNCE